MARRVTKAMLEEQVAALRQAASARIVQVRGGDAPAVRELPGFVKAEEYGTAPPMPGEIGAFEHARFIEPPPVFDPAAGVAGVRRLYALGAR